MRPPLQQIVPHGFMRTVEPGLEVLTGVAGKRRAEATEGVLAAGTEGLTAAIEPRVNDPARRIAAANGFALILDQRSCERLGERRHFRCHRSVDARRDV